MQSPREIRQLGAAMRRQRALEEELDDATAEAATLTAKLAEAQRQVTLSLDRLDKARQRGLEEAASELAHHGHQIRVLHAQVRHLTGVLRAGADQFLDGDVVAEALAELERIAARER